ncbi:LysM repeat-containing protein [Deinococcus peraridilitoris DSM 19664]|uniref:LysM repeat-containing protein n=2 Tax=Deinococcus TaxID=1298 RepID=L0A4C6_DEIPD|nr:LysM repeat-containing protein [Deinococcus peraridilitoris DSM 19664]
MALLAAALWSGLSLAQTAAPEPSGIPDFTESILSSPLDQLPRPGETGQPLATPAVPVTGVRTSPKLAPLPTYVVRRGDTLYRIAKEFGTSVESLMALNRLESVTVDVGRQLKLPGGSPLPAARNPTTRAAVAGPSAWNAKPPAVTSSGFSSRGQPVVRAASMGAASQAYLGGLTYARQTYNNCGPAAVSSVLGYYGFRVSQEELRPVLRPKGGYMSASVIDPLMRRYGLKATVYKSGNLGAVKRLVSQGIPVIVLQWLDRPGGIPHFRVVRGFDDSTSLVWVADTMIAEAAYVSYRDFEILWNTQGRLMIPVYPPTHEAQVRSLVGL